MTEKKIILELSLHEAQQLVMNLGGQSAHDAQEHYDCYTYGRYRKHPKLDDIATYNIFYRLDDLVADYLKSDKKTTKPKKKPAKKAKHAKSRRRS